MLLRRLARPLLASAFVVDGVDTLLHPERRVEAATTLMARAKEASPGESGAKISADPAMVVRVNAGAQVAGGVLLALGRAPRAAALVLAATVVPAAVTEQDFWAEKDPERKAAKRAAFLKDVSLLGGLLIASADTEGKPSLGWRGRRAAQSAMATVSAALPIGASSDGAGDRLHDTAIRARALASTAAARSAELAEAAQAKGAKLAEVAKERGPELAEAAKERGAHFAELAKERGPEFAEAAKERSAHFAELAKERGPEFAEAAKERAAYLAELAKERGPEFAEAARERGADWAEIARERGSEWAEVAKDRGPELAATARKRGAHLVDSVRDTADTKPRRRWR
ncbi:DoxX family membrane protein [Nocardia sp. NPDC050406]|uniref:DoxX family membrane protein n=1 Tax=Nocardia sp. NPDC050406 TaxID=3364318 RepID=UPI00378CC404